jgi:hypothetical protein
MSKFNIKEGSIKVLGGVKTAMEVMFKAEDGRSVTCNHEVESVEVDEIERQLQLSANEFEGRKSEEAKTPELETGKDLFKVFLEPVIKLDLEPVIK